MIYLFHNVNQRVYSLFVLFPKQASFLKFIFHREKKRQNDNLRYPKNTKEQKLSRTDGLARKNNNVMYDS